MLGWEPHYYNIGDGQIFTVAYAGRKLLDRERRYSVTDRECLGIVWGIKKFAMYLYGKQFTLQTDHRPLQFLSPRIMRKWAEKWICCC